MIVAIAVISLLIGFNRISLVTLQPLQSNWPWLFLAFLVMIPPFMIVSYRFQIVLESQGVHIPFIKALRWTMIGSFFDLAMPSSNGGDVIKAGYVVSGVKSGLKTGAVMAVAFDRVIGLLGLFLLACVACILGWNVLEGLPSRYFVVMLSFVFGVLPLVLFRAIGSRRLYNSQRFNKFTSSFKWGLRLKGLVGSFNALREHPNKLFASLGLSVLNHIFWCGSLLFITIAVGNDLSLAKALVIFPLAIFGGVFGVAGGFGVGTAVFDFLFSHFLSIPNGALVGLIFQILGAVSRLAGMPFYLLEHSPSNQFSNAKTIGGAEKVNL